MKINNIQGLRAIAVILVLFSHLFRIEEKYGSDKILSDYFLGGISGVDLFFVISGFIMVITTHGKFGNASNAFSFIYKRATRIFPLYLFYTLVVLVIALIVPSWVNSGANYDLISSLLLLPNEHSPLLAVGWTLIHEMYFYYVFLLFLFFSEKMLLPLFAIWAVIILFANLFLAIDTPLLKLVFSPLTFEFICGGVLALLYKSKRYSFNVIPSVAVIVFSFAFMFISSDLFSGINSVQPHGIWRFLLFGIPASFILFFIVCLEEKNIGFPLWMVKIGDSSYSTYLSHVLVLSVVGRIWQVIAIDDFFLDNVFALLLLVLACLSYGWVSYIFLEKNMLKASRSLYAYAKKKMLFHGRYRSN